MFSFKNKHLNFTFLFLVIFLVLLQIFLNIFDVPSYIFPSPTKVAIAMIEVLKINKIDFLHTFSIALLGFTLSIFLAIFFSYLIDKYLLLEKIFYPILIAMQSVPTIILAPLFALWFGYGVFPKILVVVMICFFPIIVNLLQGYKSIDKDYFKLMKIYQASHKQIFYYVKFKGSIKPLFAGLKIAITYSFIGAIFAEMMGGRYGIGLALLKYQRGFKLEYSFAIIILTMLISYISFKIIIIIERRYFLYEKN